MKIINFIPYGTRLGFHTEGVAATMMANDYKFFQCVCFQQNQREECRDMGEVTGAITAESGMHNTNYICYSIEGNTVDRESRKNGRGWCEEVSPTLNTQDRHAVVYDGSSVTSPKNWNNPKPGDPCYALHTDSRNYVVIAMEGNGIRPSHMGNGYSESGAMYTLNTIEQHGVCYEVRDE